MLFSAQPIPPEQGTAKQIATERGSRAVDLAGPAHGRGRAQSRLPARGAIRAAHRAALARRACPDRARARATAALLSGNVFPAAPRSAFRARPVRWRWRELCSRSPASGCGAGGFPVDGRAILVGIALLVASPYLISSLGRGITPPADGVSVGLWLTWQLAILVSASALLVPSAALFRGDGPEPRSSSRAIGGGRNRVRRRHRRRAGVEPARRLAGLVHLAVDAGAAPGHAARAPMGRHQRHRAGGGQLVGAGHLGRGALRQDPGRGAGRRSARRRARSSRRAAARALRRSRCAARRRRRPPPRCTRSGTAPPWARRAIRPTSRSWDNRGRARSTSWPLDSLDLPPSLLSTVVRNMEQTDTQRIVQLSRIPGVHYVMTVRVSPGEVMTASVGPRSDLVLPGRVGRLLDPTRPAVTALSAVALAPPRDPSERLPAAALAARGLDRPKRVSRDPPGRHPGGARDRGPARTGTAVRPRSPGRAARRRACSRRSGSWRSWFPARAYLSPRWRSLARSFRIRLAVDPRRLLPPSRRRLCGMELRPSGRGGRSGAATSSSPRPFATRCSRRRIAAGRRARDGGAAARAEPADRRRPGALSWRAAGRRPAPRCSRISACWAS